MSVVGLTILLRKLTRVGTRHFCEAGAWMGPGPGGVNPAMTAFRYAQF
jgi:hypothetical protein